MQSAQWHFRLPCGAGLAVRAVVFHLAVQAGVAVHAVVFLRGVLLRGGEWSRVWSRSFFVERRHFREKCNPASVERRVERRAHLAARGDARVSEAKDAVPRWARSKAARDAERVGEPSRASSAFRVNALDIPTSLAPTDAELEAARLKLEKAERDETAFAARLEADATDTSALDIPDARREFLVAEREAKALAREEEEGGTKQSRAQKSAWTAPDPLDEDPEGAELAGIDGVIRTAEAMSEVWAADPKMRVGRKADAPAAVASRTDVLRANVPLRDDASRRRRKKSGVLGETRRAEDEPAGDETEARTAVGSLLRELGARRA